MKEQTRNFTYKLIDENNEFTSNFIFFLKEQNKQLNKLVGFTTAIYSDNKEKLDKALKSKGNFRTELLRLLKSDYKEFYQSVYIDSEIYGNKAKYFRTVIEECRRIILSRFHRQTIIKMIENFLKINNLTVKQLDYSRSNNPSLYNDFYQKIFDDVCEFNRHKSDSKQYQLNWLSKAEFNNIIKQLTNSESSETTLSNKDNELSIYAIDYSSEDEQISEFSLKTIEEHIIVEFKLKYSNYLTKNDSLLTYQCKVPKKQFKGLEKGYTKIKKVTRPRVFIKSLDLSPNQLYISFNYEVTPIAKQIDTTDLLTRTMGIDIGVAKSATAAIIDVDWELVDQDEKEEVKETEYVTEYVIKNLAISNELTVSEKTKETSAHIDLLKTEQNHIFAKENQIAKLLKIDNSKVIDETKTNSDLFKKYNRLRDLRLNLRHKVSNLKEELAYLTARDMVSHAIDNNVDLITMEQLSWIRDQQHTTWDYNQIQQKIVHEANLYGIKVKKVSCAYSSKHNPLTLEKDEMDKNRQLIKCLFDRDYAAAIILARRGFKQLNKKKLQLLEDKDKCSNCIYFDSFYAVSYSVKPSLFYRQLDLSSSYNNVNNVNIIQSNSIMFANYSIL
jgi:hypothetical protein